MILKHLTLNLLVFSISIHQNSIKKFCVVSIHHILTALMESLVAHAFIYILYNYLQ